MFLPPFVRRWMNGKAFAPRRARPATIRSDQRRRPQLEVLEDRTVPSALVVSDFPSLGGFPSLAGSYYINTSETPTMTEPNGTIINGVAFNGIAVFAFDSIAVGSGMTITGSGTRPLALLSYGDVSVSGTGLIDVSGSGGGFPSGGPGGPGGGGGGHGEQFLLLPPPPHVIPPFPGFGPGGGGVSSGGSFGGPGGGVGGGTYGDLALLLQGGSGGGGGGSVVPSTSGGGGGGGGGLEIGALGSIVIDGLGIHADGGMGGSRGGGGSGGGIFLHSDSVVLNGLLSAHGGAVGLPGGGGGGGGRVSILVGPGGFTNTGTIDVGGGIGGLGGGVGAIEVRSALTVQGSVTTPVLSPPNQQLVNVGLSVQASDPNATIQVQVFADDGAQSSDAAGFAPGQLTLRSHRQGDGSGRVYLIVVKATDAVGDVALSVCTVVVPHDQSASSMAAVNQQAADAEAYYQAFGTAPPGYALLG